ncbi:meiotic recombination protein REC8 homolog isoform X3 [Rhineura floridana]|uniref:meiotic recombination protein REC8 homolog isoform X3 n=1 Tax=Rhineura floridana TaxID=261503 RepID=UPI002AC8119C|nr:meiotic recombination protein REC8 homolog isoform X3 [Rhineura floridana]
MFYYPSVLQRHTGCFATIWLAATGATKLLKREYLKVNVPQTCEEIMAFILVRAPPPMPGAPRPRFSLYLSAQLQYGVVRVYSRQCQYLIEEIQHILERLNRARQQIRIDLTDLEQQGLLLPDQLALMGSLEEAPDPFFGMMEPVLPSPVSIPHVRSILEAATPERSPLERLPPSLWGWKAGELPITVSPETITLKEPEPITLLKIEGERDLPEITAQEIDLLVEQEGFLVPGEEKPLRSPRVSSRKRRAEEESAEEVREQEPLVSLGLSPPTRIGEELSAAARETGLLFTEEIPLPSKVPLLPLEMTPLSEGPRLLPSPHSPPVSPLLERRSPLSPEEMILLPPKRLKTPAELLGTPTYGWMHPTLNDLWARCTNLQRVDYARQRAAAAEEEALREEEEAVQKAEFPSELEELRAAEEPSVPPVGSSEISLETTEEELRPSLVVGEERILLEPEAAALPIVPELPEISFELPLEKDVVTMDYVRRFISVRLEQAGEIEFDQLVPFVASRAVASRIFYICLVLAANQCLRLEQREPYGQIVIKPGPRFHLR